MKKWIKSHLAVLVLFLLCGSILLLLTAKWCFLCFFVGLTLSYLFVSVLIFTFASYGIVFISYLAKEIWRGRGGIVVAKGEQTLYEIIHNPRWFLPFYTVLLIYLLVAPIVLGVYFASHYESGVIFDTYKNTLRNDKYSFGLPPLVKFIYRIANVYAVSSPTTFLAGQMGLDCDGGWFFTFCSPNPYGVFVSLSATPILVFFVNYVVFFRYRRPYSSHRSSFLLWGFVLVVFLSSWVFVATDYFIRKIVQWQAEAVWIAAYGKAATDLAEKASPDFFQISNFHEEPLYNAQGKIEAIDVSYKIGGEVPKEFGVGNQLYIKTELYYLSKNGKQFGWSDSSPMSSRLPSELYTVGDFIHPILIKQRISIKESVLLIKEVTNGTKTSVEYYYPGGPWYATISVIVDGVVVGYTGNTAGLPTPPRYSSSFGYPIYRVDERLRTRTYQLSDFINY